MSLVTSLKVESPPPELPSCGGGSCGTSWRVRPAHFQSWPLTTSFQRSCMPRRRTGALVPPGADGLWKARVTREAEDGSTTRPLYSLGTADEALAKRKLAKLVAQVESGHCTLDALDDASAPEALREYAQQWLRKREAQGIVMAPDERRMLERHVLPAIGHLMPCDVPSSKIKMILEVVIAKTYVTGKTIVRERRYRRDTVAKVRGVMHRLFRSAQEDDLIERNPVCRGARAPKLREAREGACMILTDAESRRRCPSRAAEVRPGAADALRRGAVRGRACARATCT